MPLNWHLVIVTRQNYHQPPSDIPHVDTVRTRGYGIPRSSPWRWYKPSPPQLALYHLHPLPIFHQRKQLANPSFLLFPSLEYGLYGRFLISVFAFLGILCGRAKGGRGGSVSVICEGLGGAERIEIGLGIYQFLSISSFPFLCSLGNIPGGPVIKIPYRSALAQ
jgi:hypothetical protein